MLLDSAVGIYGRPPTPILAEIETKPSTLKSPGLLKPNFQ